MGMVNERVRGDLFFRLWPWAFMFVLLGSGLARTGGYADQYQAGHCFLIIPIWACVCGLAVPRDRLGQRIALTLLGWLMYSGLATLLWARLPDFAQGRFVQDVLAVLVVLVIGTMMPDPRRLWRDAVVVSATLCLGILILVKTGLCRDTFIFGNRNYLIATCLPFVVGWLVWACWGVRPTSWRRWRTREDAENSEQGKEFGPWVQAAFSVLVMTTFVLGWLVFDPEGVRRGGLLGICAGLLAAGWILLHHHRPQRAWSLLRIAGALGILGLFLLGSMPVTDLRSDRILMYKGGLATAQAGFPWGWGAYGYAAESWIDSEWTHVRAALGLWGLHSHNELLEALINYGIIGGILTMAFLFALLMAVLRIANFRLRLAMAASLACFAVHAATDNSYGQMLPQLWMATLIGIVMRCGATDVPSEPQRARQVGRMLVAIPALVCIFVWWEELPLMTKRGDADEETTIAAIATSRNAYAVEYELGTLIPLLIAKNSASPEIDTVLHVQQEKLGGSGSYVADLERVYRARKAHFPIREGKSPALELGNERLGLEAALLMQRFRPMRTNGFSLANEILRRDPGLARSLSVAQQREIYERSLWFAGSPDAPPVPPQDWVVPFHRGAEAVAQATWLVIRGAPAQRMAPMLAAIGKEYAHIPDVALLLARAAIVYEGHDVPWLNPLLPRISMGLSRYSPAEFARLVCAPIANPNQARPAWAFLRATYPAMTRDIEAGHAEPWSQRLGSVLPEAAQRVFMLLHSEAMSD